MPEGPFRVISTGTDIRHWGTKPRSGPFSVQCGKAGGRIMVHDVPLGEREAESVRDALNWAFAEGMRHADELDAIATNQLRAVANG